MQIIMPFFRVVTGPAPFAWRCSRYSRPARNVRSSSTTSIGAGLVNNLREKARKQKTTRGYVPCLREKLEPDYAFPGRVYKGSRGTGQSLRIQQRNQQHLATTMAAEFEAVYSYGVDVISLLQSSFPDSEKFFMEISNIFDPKYVFTLFFPIVFALQWAVGVKLFATIVAVEWLNQILKWLMHGDRPYWWVHEVESKLNSTMFPEIYQFPTTCETGPGMPSGHAMATSAAWYVLVKAAVDYLVNPSKLSSRTKSQVTQLLWAGYATILTLVTMSRMYIAAHFPHQCLLGALLGVICARYIYSASKWLSMKRCEWLLLASFVLLSAIGTYSFLLVTGSDPSWSISRAMKWCVKREYIHVDTTPFYSLSRYSGAVFGLGLGLTSRFFTERPTFTRAQVLAIMAFGVVVGHSASLLHVAIPKTNEQVFYALEFVLNCLLPYAIVALTPFAVKSLSGKAKSS